MMLDMNKQEAQAVLFALKFYRDQVTHGDIDRDDPGLNPKCTEYKRLTAVIDALELGINISC